MKRIERKPALRSRDLYRLGFERVVGPQGDISFHHDKYGWLMKGIHSDVWSQYGRAAWTLDRGYGTIAVGNGLDNLKKYLKSRSW